MNQKNLLPYQTLDMKWIFAFTTYLWHSMYSKTFPIII